MVQSRHEPTTFALRQGRAIGRNYVVDSLLGAGWEGEVYRVLENRTGAARAAKLFFPQRNHRDRAVDFYARKLEQLRDCSLVIRYHHSELIRHRGQPTPVLISEYVEGILLEDLIAHRPGNRLPEYASDITDGLNAQSLATTLFLFFACLPLEKKFRGASDCLG